MHPLSLSTVLRTSRRQQAALTKATVCAPTTNCLLSGYTYLQVIALILLWLVRLSSQRLAKHTSVAALFAY